MKNLWKTEPAVLIGAVQALLALLAAFGFDFISPAQSIAIVAFISTATLLIRSIVYSPASAEEIKAQREMLAQSVKRAEVTGKVPETAAEVAESVIKGAATPVISAALAAAAAAVGLSPAFVAAASPAAVQAAIEAVKARLEKPLNSEQLKASRDDELRRRSEQ